MSPNILLLCATSLSQVCKEVFFLVVRGDVDGHCPSLLELVRQGSAAQLRVEGALPAILTGVLGQVERGRDLARSDDGDGKAVAVLGEVT